MSKDIYFLLAIFLTRTTALSVILSPGPPVEVPINSSVTFTCTTTYTMLFVKLTDEVFGLETNSRASVGNINNVCITLSTQPNYSVNCTSVTGPYKFTIQSVTMDYHNKIVRCTVQYGTNSKDDIAYADTRIMLEVQLEKAELTPSGMITINEDVVKDFQCKATSLPRASIKWKLGESPMTSTNNTTIDTITSKLTYKAQRDDNGKRLVCEAGNTKRTVNASILLIVQYKPTVTIFPDDSVYYIVENTTEVQLMCKVASANPLATTFRWYKNNSLVNNKMNYNITKVDRSFSGNYTCQAENIVGNSTKSSPIQLNVLYGVMVNPISRQSVNEGEKLTVNCTGDSNPVIRDNDVVWTKKNSTFRETGKKLTITSINRTDAGTYICTVAINLTPSVGQNITVTGSTNVEVDVLYKPTVTIFPDDSVYYIVENTTEVQLMCKVATANPLATTFRWYKNNLLVNNEMNYNITKVDRSFSGNYTCQAENIVGNSTKSSPIQLNVLYGPGKPKLTASPPLPWFEGNSTSIICSFEDGNPVATIKWSLSNEETHILVFESLDKEQNGHGISCTVYNNYSTEISDELKLNVQYTPKVSLEKTEYTANEGQNVSMLCTVQGNPVPTAQWLRDDKTLTKETENQSTLLLEDISRNSNGSYICIGKSHSFYGILTHSEQLYIDVNYAPDVTITYHNPEIISEGKELNLLCSARGRPANYTFLGWTQYYGNTLIRTNRSGQLLRITNISYQDLGNYSCSVSNGVMDRFGHLNRTATKDVNFKFEPVFVEYKKAITAKVARKLLVTIDLVANPDINQPVIWINTTDDTPVANDTSVFTTTMKTSVNASVHGVITVIERYGYRLSLQMEHFEPYNAGVYTVLVNNSFSENNLSVTVILSDIPSSPLEFAVSEISSTMVSVTWTAGSNGGNSQSFIIIYGKLEEDDRLSFNISEKSDTKRYYETIYNLSPSTMYIISIDAINSEGFAASVNNTIYVQTLGTTDESSSIIGPVGGAIGGTLFAGLVGTAIVLFLRRHQGKMKENERTKLTRSQKYNRDNEDELKDNILYESSGPNFTAKPEGCGTLYAVVNKLGEKDSKRTTDIEETRLHADVHTNKHYSNRGKSNAKLEMQDTEVNSSKKESDDVYENVRETENNQKEHKNIKKDGLVYAELVFNETTRNGRKFFIHGIENKTNYADIDLSLKADPVASDDKDDEEKK